MTVKLFGMFNVFFKVQPYLGQQCPKYVELLLSKTANDNKALAKRNRKKQKTVFNVFFKVQPCLGQQCPKCVELL